MRQKFAWIISIGLIFAALYGIVIISEKTTELKKQYKDDRPCPVYPVEVTKKQAWEDMQLDPEFREGFITCYCKPLLLVYNIRVYDLLFTEFNNDQRNYCGEWATNYFVQNALVMGTSLLVVCINVVMVFIFEKLALFEKYHTHADETLQLFKKLTIMMFINIAIVILLVNLNSLDGPFLGFIPILNGEYEDFTSSWYQQVG